MVTRKSILKKQTIIRRKTNRGANAWSFIKHVGSFSFKCSLLVMGIFAISLLFLSFYQYLLTSPYFSLEHVIVLGVDKDIKDDLLGRLGLDDNITLLAMNLGELKNKLESHPWIRTVELEKQFPHKLIIRAEKEVPRALVALENLHYVNRYGSVFKALDTTDDVDYPIITGIREGDRDMDDKLLLATGILDQLEHEDGPWSLNELSEIHVNRNGDLSLYSTSLPAVLYINSELLAERKEELAKIVRHLKGQGLIHLVKSIDLNYVNGAVVSFRKG